MLRSRSHLVGGTAAAVALFSLTMSHTAAVAAPHGCLPGSLKSVLSQLRQKFGSPRVISTHRSGATIRGTGKRSYHASCRAIDFHPAPGQYGAVVGWLKRNHSGGVGTYSGRHNHIHIDNGPRTRWHKSY